MDDDLIVDDDGGGILYYISIIYIISYIALHASIRLKDRVHLPACCMEENSVQNEISYIELLQVIWEMKH